MTDSSKAVSKYFEEESLSPATSKYFDDNSSEIPLYEQSIENSIEEGMGSLIEQADAGDWDTSDSLQVARAFTDGLWMNKGEEAGAWISALVYKRFRMYGSNDKTVRQIKDEMLARSEADSAAFVEERPVAAIGANIAGNILSPVSIKGGQLLSQARTLRQGEIARQSAVQTGTALGGRSLVGTSAAQADDAGRLAQQLSGFSPRAFNIATQTRTPLLGAGLVAGESAVIGAEGDTLGEKAQNAAISGAIGGVFGLGLSGAGVAVNKALQSNIAQQVGKGANFVNLMFTEHALAPVYQHVVSKAYGGRSLIEQQVSALKNRMPSLDVMKQRGVNLKENAQKTLARAKAVSSGQVEQQTAQARRLAEDLTDELTAGGRISINELDSVSQKRIEDLKNAADPSVIKAAAAREADAAVNAVESSFRTEAIVKSLPTNAREGLADDIAAMSPQDALKAVRESWTATGFSAAKNANYRMNLPAVEKGIHKILKDNATKVALAGANAATTATTIKSYVSAMIRERAKNGVMKGEDLLQMRSEIGTVINNLSDNQAATREITKPIQRYFDDLLISKLNKTDAASFLKDRELWKLKSTLEDAVSVATGRNKNLQGAFDTDDWISANKKQGTYFSSVGEGVLQKDAQDVSKLAKQRKELIEGNAKKDADVLKKNSEEAIKAEDVLLKTQKNELTKSNQAVKREIQRAFRESKKTAKDVEQRTNALAEESARFTQAMSTIDNDIAKLERGLKFFKEVGPKDSSIFERLFATSLLASATGLAGIFGGAALGAGVATVGVGAAKALSLQSTQRLLAGQTGFQRAGSEIAKRLDEAAQQLSERTGVNYRPVAATAIAPDAGDKKVFNEQTKRSIMGQGQLSKARIYTGLQNAGKLVALEAQDPALYKALKDAFDSQSKTQ